jgi:hypothetical protein
MDSFLALVFALISLSVHAIFLFKREILFDSKKFGVLLKIAAGLFLLRYLLQWASIHPRNIGAIQVPFLALLLFYVMRLIFNVILDRDPEDSYMSNDMSLMKDGVFNFLFWVIGLMVPVLFVYEVF